MKKLSVPWELLDFLVKMGAHKKEQFKVEELLWNKLVAGLDLIGESKKNAIHLVSKTSMETTVREAFDSYIDYDEDPFDTDAWIQTPETELVEQGFKPDSVIALIHGTDGGGPCYGYRYYIDVEQAVAGLVKENFVTDAMEFGNWKSVANLPVFRSFETDIEEEKKGIISAWGDSLILARLLLLDKKSNSDQKIERLEKLLSCSLFSSVTVTSLEKHVRSFSETKIQDFETKTGSHWLMFNPKNEVHWSWALTQMEPSNWGI